MSLGEGEYLIFAPRRWFCTFGRLDRIGGAFYVFATLRGRAVTDLVFQ